MILKQITLISSSGESINAELEINSEIPEIILKEQSLNYIGKGANLYRCLQDLHQQMDILGCKIMCQGCRYDVRPSGMSLDMCDGRIAYKLVFGKKSDSADTVDIFASTDEPDAVRSLQDQQSFYSDWLESIGISFTK